MATLKVTVFKPYPFKKGQKIRIEGGPRNGDWEVVDVTEHKLTLRCPVTHRELKCNKFCYFVEERENEAWPSH
ncbi:MAG: hypothetical protein DRH12_07690 [Deltaproteobacteria bacterium]|nr:MAG: hypothetical protein DRH12_07690 [Deltaproteobacteria bacterium]